MEALFVREQFVPTGSASIFGGNAVQLLYGDVYPRGLKSALIRGSDLAF
jgi:hypothetical protein